MQTGLLETEERLGKKIVEQMDAWAKQLQVEAVSGGGLSEVSKKLADLEL